MKLTEKAVASLALPDGVADRIWFDDDLPGFGLRIRSGGKRTWIVQYKQGGKQRRMTLGTVDLAGRAESMAASIWSQPARQPRICWPAFIWAMTPRARRSKPGTMPEGHWPQSCRTTFTSGSKRSFTKIYCGGGAPPSGWLQAVGRVPDQQDHP